MSIVVLTPKKPPPPGSHLALNKDLEANVFTTTEEAITFLQGIGGNEPETVGQ